MKIDASVFGDVHFREIDNGDVFMYDNSLFMKIEEYCDPVLDAINAVRLSTGIVESFANERVRLIPAKIVISD